MAKIAGIEVADGLGDLKPVTGKLTLDDFLGDSGIYEMYTTALSIADTWDNHAATDIAKSHPTNKTQREI